MTTFPHAAPVRILELGAGTLVGFKASPGRTCAHLFADSKAQSDSRQSHWSAIYVQLGIEQAIRYAPNQFDRGASVTCIVALRVREGQSLRVVVCDDPRMAEKNISSDAKAKLVREQLATVIDEEKGEPQSSLLTALGESGLALCLIDCEDYELAVPHLLFNEDLVEAHTLIEMRQSQRVPGMVGDVVGSGSTAAAVQSVVRTTSRGELSDVSALSVKLRSSLEASGLATMSTWLVRA